MDIQLAESIEIGIVDKLQMTEGNSNIWCAAKFCARGLNRIQSRPNGCVTYSVQVQIDFFLMQFQDEVT